MVPPVSSFSSAPHRPRHRRSEPAGSGEAATQDDSARKGAHDEGRSISGGCGGRSDARFDPLSVLVVVLVVVLVLVFVCERQRQRPAASRPQRPPLLSATPVTALELGTVG